MIDSVKSTVEVWQPSVALHISELRVRGRLGINQMRYTYTRHLSPEPETYFNWVWVQVDSEQLVPLAIPVEGAVSPPASLPRQLDTIQPEPAFRQNLHRALEESHRQQAAQRALGTHAPIDWRETEEAQEAQSKAWSTALLFMALSLLWFFLGRRPTP